MSAGKIKLWAAGFALVLLAALIAWWAVRHRPGTGAFALLDLLPPGADAYGVVDLQALQSSPAVSRLLADPPGLAHDPEYDHFLRQTGFRYQDDLQQLAVAKRASNWLGVARVKVDRAQLQNYLSAAGAAQSQSGGYTIYAFGTVRPFRLALLDNSPAGTPGLAAFSIGNDSGALQQVLARQDRAVPESAGGALRAAGELPPSAAENQLWVYAQVDRLLAGEPQGLPIGSYTLDPSWLHGSRALYLSAQSSTLLLDVQLRDVCDDPATAERLSDWVKALLTILQSAPAGASAQKKPNYASLLAGVSVASAGDSLEVRWRGDLTTLLKLAGFD